MTDPTAAVEPGRLQHLTERVWRLTAPNPGVMTGPGTNTYLVGDERGLVVVDPGPDDAGHVRAIARAAEEGIGGRVAAICLTHTHLDHAPGALHLSRLTGAPVAAFDARDGVEPTRHLGHGEVVEVPAATLEAVHTPGHASNHLCYLLREEALVFSGDHVMQGSTVVITPPDGHMGRYLESLGHLRERRPQSIAPGHGQLITQPLAVIDHYIEHRLAREASIHAALERRGDANVDVLVADVYTDVPEALHPVARYSVWAHLQKLEGEGRAAGGPGLDDRWESVQVVP